MNNDIIKNLLNHAYDINTFIVINVLFDAGEYPLQLAKKDILKRLFLNSDPYLIAHPHQICEITGLNIFEVTHVIEEIINESLIAYEQGIDNFHYFRNYSFSGITNIIYYLQQEKE